MPHRGYLFIAPPVQASTLELILKSERPRSRKVLDYERGRSLKLSLSVDA